MKKRPRKSDLKAARPKPTGVPLWAAPVLIAALVLIFYSVPLGSEAASIQWDAADLHYPFQKYFSDHIRAGDLPLWTPYLFSGYPFMAYPETGAWYIPHWPFFLLGITPRMIQAELALNAFIACLGAFLLLSRITEKRTSALAGAICYGLSGFFAGHASHVGIFSAAAWLPWLLLAFRKAVDAAAVRYTILGGLVGAAMIFAGYIQTAMYGYMALGLYSLADLCRTPRRWLRIASIVAGMLAIAIVVASVQIVPALELTQSSHRSRSDYSGVSEGTLELRALPTLIVPDWLGAISGNYTGPFDVTQYYFYAGLLLIPLAILGIAKTRNRLHALLLVVPALWFMLGRTAGLYSLAMLIPGMSKVRAPIQGWFIVALGLAMLAALGADWAQRRWPFRYLGALIVAILFIDVWYWNAIENPIAYAHASFERVYGPGEEFLRRTVVPAVPPLARYAPGRGRIGPIDASLYLKLENTDGYAALPISDYMRYFRTMNRDNPKLRDGLNVLAYVSDSRLVRNASPLPRAYFPKSITDVKDAAQAREALRALDPHSGSFVLAPHEPIQQDPAATAQILSHDEESYRIAYRAASPSLLRLSVPHYPGWHASLNGRELPLAKVDVALMGVVVPAGEGEVLFEFRNDSLRLGAAISLAGLIALCALLAAPYVRARLSAGARNQAPSRV